MPRIKLIYKSRIAHQCGRCGDAIPAGTAYRKTKPRYGSAMIRCMKSTCDFRPTELSSAKTARVEEAVDCAKNLIWFAADADEIEAALQEAANVAREVADEYQEASDNWAGGNGHDEFQEKAEACSSFADDLEAWTPDEIDGDEIEGGEGWSEEILQEMRDAAMDLLDQFSV